MTDPCTNNGGYAAGRPGAQSYRREESVMEQDIRYVGLDVHKETIAVAIAESGTGAACSRGTIRHQPAAVAKLIRQLGPAERLRCAYEAGPTGYGLYRQLTRLGVACLVAAPSLI